MTQISRHLSEHAFGAEGASAFIFGPFRLHLPERCLKRHGVRVPLGGRAFDILSLLVQRRGEVVLHDELMAHVWADITVSPGTPRVHLAALRKTLGCRADRTRYIANIPGRGYCFVASGVTVVGSVVGQGVDSIRAAEGARSGPGRPGRGLKAPGFVGDVSGLSAGLITANTPIQTLATPNKTDVPISGNFAPRHKANSILYEDSSHTLSPMGSSSDSSGLSVTPIGEGFEMICNRFAIAAAITLLTSATEAALVPAQAQTTLQTAETVTHYRTANIDGIRLFYREAGPANGPVVLLLHGFPTSSHMFRNLIPTLSDRYHVIAPDYPGFGQSAAPDHTQFAYTFAHYASLVDSLLQHLGASRYSMYVMDYGAPVGFRLALLHPERVSAFVVQNGNAYAEGLGAFWDPIKAYWADGSAAHRQALNFLVAPETTIFQYTDGVSDVSRIDPDNWVHDQVLLDRPGNRDIQLDLFHDYGSNVPLYPDFQAFFRKYQPPMLIVWGKNDKIFPAAGAAPYLRDLPKAELHLLDTGHFALEDKLDVMAPMIRGFLDRSISSN